MVVLVVVQPDNTSLNVPASGSSESERELDEENKEDKEQANMANQATYNFFCSFFSTLPNCSQGFKTFTGQSWFGIEHAVCL